MANEKNLTHKLTVAEQRAGGIASGKARAEKANLRKCLEILLETEMEDKNHKKMSGAEALSARLFNSALKGDVRAFEVLRDTAGQKPVENIHTEQTVVDMSKFSTEEIKAMLDDDIS